MVRPKSWAGIRDIPIPPALVRFLQERHAALNPNPEAFVFHAWQTDRATNRQNFHGGGWRRILAMADLLVDDKPRYHFHHFRHFAASAFIEQGLPPKRIQEIMGHTSITMTFDLYGHFFADTDQADTAALNIETMLIPATRQESDITA